MGRKSPEVADHPANRVLLDYLRAQARRPTAPIDYIYAIDEWELHTHPDLVERLEELAPDGIPVIPLFGVPALATNGIVAVVALGTSWLMVRLPQLPDDLETQDPIPPLSDHGWQAISAWQSEIPTAEAKQRLTQLVNDAFHHARSLNQ
ncbi:hypothetical protein [Actinoallomurus iriomotensis]|uniref:Uncharacterized protein n=1 Tax=Actinoallomurus iriomotensis TaxID=478107 RepID=A0A9W6W5X3_9ACTN|nr:hypothetical protein [Actinoallomurus iriomotensis]GLY91914.1 hypothetical protein Airi02_098420 [Actinoallomurus iriomotensis]